MRDVLCGAARFIALVVVVAGMTVMPPVPTASAVHVAATGCATVDELAGYVPLYELDVPRTAYWPKGTGVPYALNRSLKLDRQPSAPYLDRVAYCLDTVSRAGRHEWAYASFDALTNDPRALGVPNTTTARPVKALTTWGSNVTHVERADGGYVRFWPGTYNAATGRPSGSASGYGALQVHNTAAGETVLALNGWSHKKGRYLDIGTGNQRTGHPDWTFSQSARTLASATLTVYVKPAAPNATTCEQTVGELADYRLLYDAETPRIAAPWAGGVRYAVDNSETLRTPVSRVAYCLDGIYGTTAAWAYAAMDAWTQDLKKLGVPMSQTTRRRVADLTVRGSDVVPSDHSTGYLEFWPNQYGRERPPGAPAGGSAGAWDIVDNPRPSSRPVPGAGGYGSFQVHDLTHRQTVLAVNGWAHLPKTRVDIGVGTAPAGAPDWTFAGNARGWTRPHLRVYVKPAGVDLTTGPVDAQLYPRDRATNTATVEVRGRVTDPDVTAVDMNVYREGTLVTTRRVPAAEFCSLSAPITAERASYTVEVWAQRPTGRTLVRRASDIVAGDVYLVEGQSNAVAAGAGFAGTAASQDASPWVRTFGHSSADPVRSVHDRSWYRATGEGFEPRHTSQRGAIGQLGMRLGQVLADRTGIPVAILNGADGGRPSGFFRRADDLPADPATNYGRLLGRVTGGGLAGAVRGVIWYQGESDTGLSGNPTAAQHDAHVRALMTGWRADFTGLEHIYVVQIRNHCRSVRSTAVQEVQRRFAGLPGTSVMTTMGLDGHDGCHYAYRQGYRQLADWLSLQILRDLHGVRPATPADPPNPLRARWQDTAHTRIRIDLTDATQTLRCAAGARADFVLHGTAARVAGVTCGTGRLSLALTGPGTGLTGITYTGHPGAATVSATPATSWIVNASGMGLLAFDKLPIG